MIKFSEYLESKHMDNYMSENLANQLNKIGVDPFNKESLYKIIKYGWKLINPSSDLGQRMGSFQKNLKIISGDGGFAIFDNDYTNKWYPYSREGFLGDRPIKNRNLGNKADKIPSMPQPDKFDMYEPTSPSQAVGSGAWDDEENSWYDRPKLKIRDPRK